MGEYRTILHDIKTQMSSTRRRTVCTLTHTYSVEQNDNISSMSGGFSILHKVAYLQCS